MSAETTDFGKEPRKKGVYNRDSGLWSTAKEEPHPNHGTRPVKNATDKSIQRKRKKVAMSMRGVYPGSGADIMDRIRKSIKKN